MLNRIVLQGRMTRDPELRYTQSQTPVASFRLAVDRDFIDRNTNNRETDFIDCVAWRGTAEFASKYFAKGSMAVVSGRLQMRDWTDRDNNKRTAAEVVVDSIYFCEKKSDQGGGQRSYQPAPAPGPAGSYSDPAFGGSAFSDLDDDDDLNSGELPF